MSKIPQFVKYAAAFEEAVRSDDWQALAPFFHERTRYDAELPGAFGGSFDGRAEVLGYFKQVLDGFDRRFATRELSLCAGPRADGDSVWLRGGVRYTAPGRPDLYFELEETLTFDGEAIVHLADRYQPEAIAAIEAYVREHGAALGFGFSVA